MSTNEQKLSNVPIHKRTIEFYDEDVNASTAIKADARELLHKYSKIPENQVEGHVEDTVCTSSFKTSPY